MEPLALINRAVAAGLSVRADGDHLFVRGPRSCEALAQEVLEHKDLVLAALVEAASNSEGGSPLVEYAAELGLTVHFTIRETEDVAGDVAFLTRVRAVLAEHPGQNLINMRIVTLDGRRPVVQWRALACEPLRHSLAGLLRQRVRRV